MIKRILPGFLLLCAALGMMLLKTADVWHVTFALCCLCSLWVVGLCFHREEQNALLEQDEKLQEVENRLHATDQSRRDLIQECNNLKEAQVQCSFQEQKKLEKIELEREASNKKTGDLFLELTTLKEAHEHKQLELAKKLEDAEYRAGHLVGEFNGLKQQLAHTEKLLQESTLELEEVMKIAHHRLEELNTVKVENFELAQFAALAKSTQELGDLKQLKNQLAEKSQALHEARRERFYLETELLALQKEKELEELALAPAEELQQRAQLEETVDHLEDLVSLVLTKKKRKKTS